MKTSAGGIGSFAPQDEIEGEQYLEVGHGNSEESVPLGGLSDVMATTEALHSAILEAGDRLTEIEAAVTQLRGQHNQVEMTMPQYAHAINTLDARLTAVAQQVARNFRLAALDAATKSGGPGLQTDAVITRAEVFLRWLDPPAPAAPPRSALDEAADTDGVRH